MRVGRYEIVEPIGQGASGQVYRARDAETGAVVALKRIVYAGTSERFELEARLLASLQHPGVVTIVDHFAAPDGVYNMVMDLVGGVDLGKVLWERGAPGLRVEDVVAWAGDACAAVQYLHDQQVVHGDLKPRNMVRGRDGVVLVDFGLASQLRDGVGGATRAGTPRFMAPEVFAGDPVSPRADVYGLAASVWNLLTGMPPAYGDERGLAESVPGASVELEAALRAGLAMSPEDRLASARELADALGAPIHGEGGRSLAHSLEHPRLSRQLGEAIAAAAAGVFEAAASSLALVDPATGELVYVASWGAGAHEIVGVRLPAGTGIAGAVVQSGEGEAIPSCRTDLRFAARVATRSGYVPHTMIVAPFRDGATTLGVLSVLDRRDGTQFGPADLARAQLFADVAAASLAAA